MAGDTHIPPSDHPHHAAFPSLNTMRLPNEGSDGSGANGVSESKSGDASPVSQTDWGEPMPLPSGLAPVAQLDPACLPINIGPWIMDTSDRMQCPPNFPAAAAMVAMGSVLGRQVGIRPKRLDNWTEVANLWGMIVGRPGTMKSPAMNEALGPLRRLEAKARDEHLGAFASYEREANIHKMRKNAAEEHAKKKFKINPASSLEFQIPVEPDAPKAKRFIISDATYEAIGVILVDNPNGILAFRDELVALLKTLDKEEYAAARGFFLSAWNGREGYTFDRIGRGHQHIEAVCVSMLGSTQPGKLATYIGRALKGGDGDDGMIQRFGVLTWPDQGGEWRNVDRLPDSSAKQLVHRVFEWLAQPSWDHVQPSTNLDDDSRYLSFDAQASERFVTWLGELEFELRSGSLHVSMESHFAKYRKLVPALALINHMADGQSGPVSIATLERAIGYAAYLKTHAKRAYSAGLRGDATTAAAILSRIRKGELADGFTSRELHQRDWSNLTDREQVRYGLDLLVDHEWLRCTEISTGGRPKMIYSINPRGVA